MTTIELIESGVDTVAELTDEQAAALQAAKIVSVAPVAPGRWLLRGSGKVGVVRVGELTVRIRPKLAIRRVFFLLGYGRRFAWRDDLVPFDVAGDLVHVLAEAFVRQADRALGRGVLQGYVEQDDELAVVRGRLRYREQVTRRFGQITPLLVRYDEFTVDIAENQLVRAAARVLRSVPGLDPTVGRRLRAITDRLDDVTDLVPGAPLPPWQPSRRNAHYDSVLWFAAMVLRHRSIELAHGSLDVNGFVVDMATVFEDFVTIALTDALEAIDGRVHAQMPLWFDTDDTVPMAPDLVWLRAGVPRAVIDAKYKAEKPSGYPNADLYQMLAYCTTLGLSEGHLVYAKGDEPVRDIDVRGSCVVLRVHALDLDQEPAELLSHIAELARTVARSATRSRVLVVLPEN